jgi:2-polyprenyl-3-methyl-5-hydroxy-6-metoxy-1,4-benzoquinol methylase
MTCAAGAVVKTTTSSIARTPRSGLADTVGPGLSLTYRVTAWQRTNGYFTRRRSGVAATAYAEHRPDYAQAAVGWALEPAPGPRVLDLGAGTGKLTATLVALGAEVSAVEPDPAMLTELRRALS